MNKKADLLYEKIIDELKGIDLKMTNNPALNVIKDNVIQELRLDLNLDQDVIDANSQ